MPAPEPSPSKTPRHRKRGNVKLPDFEVIYREPKLRDYRELKQRMPQPDPELSHTPYLTMPSGAFLVDGKLYNDDTGELLKIPTSCNCDYDYRCAYPDCVNAGFFEMRENLLDLPDEQWIVYHRDDAYLIAERELGEDGSIDARREYADAILRASQLL